MLATLYPVGGGFFWPPRLSLLFHRILHTGSAFRNIKGQRKGRAIPLGGLFVFPFYTVLQHHVTFYVLHHQAVHKTFHNLLLLNSIFDMVKCYRCISNVLLYL